jgi:hypothetical protein
MRGSYRRHCFGSRRQCLAALIFHAVTPARAAVGDKDKTTKVIKAC